MSDIFFGISDLILLLTSYLDDKDSMSLFSTNKYIHSISNKYTIKKEISFNPSLDNLDNDSIIKKYKIKNLKLIITDNYECDFISNLKLESLTIDNKFNYTIKNLPKIFTKLKLLYNTDLTTITNLPSITHLTFGDDFNKPVDNLPNSITHLTFGEFFNKSVDNLPNSITHLTFGANFNKSVDKLPNSITHLTFDVCFIKSVDKLPSSITHLTFGEFFNKPVDKLPNSITHLTFGFDFNQPVDKLPNSIKCLKFGSSFDQSLDKLPNSLTHLTFDYSFENPIYNLPNHIHIKYNEIPFYYY